ncbi:WD40-repeat-containing domain protein [Naematelia encephala]|uniref:WD40-repeat-containing domain protein n=1 Tax=Naematelia encephala TaxID=71784 RepID=A0A1Y2B8Q5_9TREE|nr:WD40-repeat-containing domain protein [Naematelia encephala]
MRPKVLEISWHETQAVYSCDFQPLPPAQLRRLLPFANPDHEEETKAEKGPVVAGGRQYRLATAGGDSKVRLWMIYPNIPSSSASTHAALTGQEVTPHPPRADYLTTLSKHTAAVNVVRFSPSGSMLASAGDDGNVILWVPSERPSATFGESSEEVPDKEHWRLQKMLQVTTKHVYDLSWSPDGEFFIAGSTDNTATIWKASTGECVFALREHSHNVQGVSWDPLNEFIATQSSDRSVHINTFAFRNGIPDVHPVSRATRMEIRHSRTPSFPSGSRPNLTRRGSTTSETGSVITSASEHTEQPNYNALPMTPTTSVPSTPQPHPMNPPPPSTARPGSRRSSFSGSQAAGSPALSAAAFPGRGRSPSPIPPLPAIRAPPAMANPVMQRLYGEEGVTRFFRRLTFSPDGSLLLTPAGQIEDQIYKGSPLLTSRSLSQDGTDLNGHRPRPTIADNGKPTVYIYARSNLARAPVAHLPGHKTASVGIRFSPVFYDLRTGPITPSEPRQVLLDRHDPNPVSVSLSMPPPPPPSEKKAEPSIADKPIGSVFALPYRLLYAVACQDAVLLYDTQQSGPIAIFRGLHYAGFTDVAWSPDGQTLMLSSADGYCSIVVFDMAELGTAHPTQQHHRQLAAIAQSHSHAAPHASAVSTPVPQSPAVSLMRQSPAPPRSEREGSTSSSITVPPQSTSIPPLFVAPPSSVSSATELILPTPGDEREGFIFGRTARSESVSSSVAAGLGLSGPGEESLIASGQKRAVEEGDGPKKKRRVALTHLGDSDAA